MINVFCCSLFCYCMLYFYLSKSLHFPNVIESRLCWMLQNAYNYYICIPVIGQIFAGTGSSSDIPRRRHFVFLAIISSYPLLRVHPIGSLRLRTVHCWTVCTRSHAREQPYSMTPGPYSAYLLVSGRQWGSEPAGSMYSTFAFAKLSTEGDFQRVTIQRNVPGDDDVQFDIGRCPPPPPHFKRRLSH